MNIEDKWISLSIDSDLSENLAILDQLLSRHNYPSDFLNAKLRSKNTTDKYWACWLAAEYPECVPALIKLVDDDDAEIAEVACHTLLSIHPDVEIDSTVFQQYKKQDIESEKLRLAQQWSYRKLDLKADKLFKSKKYSEFLEMTSPWIEGLDEITLRRIEYAKNKIV